MHLYPFIKFLLISTVSFFTYIKGKNYTILLVLFKYKKGEF